MIVDLESVSIFIRPGATDMRKQSNGLSIIVNEQMHENPGSGNLYLFCSRNKRLLKCLWWDRNGFCLCQKRVENSRSDFIVLIQRKRRAAAAVPN